MIETAELLAAGKRRPKHESLDVLYFFRPTDFNLRRVLADYAQEVEHEEKDVFERCFPCLFRNIGHIEAEPAWYSDWRMLILPGPASRDVPYDYPTARGWIDVQIRGRQEELNRLEGCVRACARRRCKPHRLAGLLLPSAAQILSRCRLWPLPPHTTTREVVHCASS